MQRSSCSKYLLYLQRKYKICRYECELIVAEAGIHVQYREHCDGSQATVSVCTETRIP